MTQSIMQRLLIAVSVLAAAPAARADGAFTIDTVSLTSQQGEQIIQTFFPQLAGQGAEVAQALTTALNPFEQQLQSQINTRLTSLQYKGFLGAMSDASAAVSKTMPFDYATDPSWFSLSVGGGAAFNNLGALGSTGGLAGALSAFATSLKNSGGLSLPSVGVAPVVSVLLGINFQPFHLANLGPIDFSRLTLYGNFATFSQTISDLQFSYSTFGLHGQYRIINSVALAPSGLLRWGGVSVGTGFDYASTHVSFDYALPSGNNVQPFTFHGQTLQTTLGWSGNAQLSAKTGIFSIPVEAMTSIQLLYLLTLYGGAAADLNFGSSSVGAQAREPATITLSDSNNHSLQIAKPEARLSFTQSKGPTWGDIRGFVGAQVNIYVLALFAQVSADTAKNLGVNVGVRAFW